MTARRPRRLLAAALALGAAVAALPAAAGSDAPVALPSAPPSAVQTAVQTAVSSPALPAAPPDGPSSPGVARWALSLTSDRHSDALALRHFGDDDWADHLAPRRGRNLAYLDDELRLSRRGPGGWTLALLGRQRATLVASEDALTLAAQLARGERAAADRRWQADLRLRGFAGIGAELGREWPLAPNWTLGGSAQGLVLTRWRERQVSGPVAFDAADGRYRFALQSDELNDRLVFPFQQGFDARGAGVLLAGHLQWQQGPATLSVRLRDLGWLHWSGVPQQRMVLDTATASTDADGFLVYKPLIQGNNRQQRTTRSAPRRVDVQAAWRFDTDAQLIGTVEHLPGFGLLPALRWQQRIGALEGSLGWRVHERRLELAAAWQGWRLQAGADRLDGSARSRSFGLSYRRLQ